MLSCRNAMATVLNPHSRRVGSGASSQAQGNLNTVPIDTLTALRLKGSQLSVVSSAPSMPRAAAERKMAPMFVVSHTASRTTTRRDFPHSSCHVGCCGRRMAQSTPRVSV